MTTRRFSAGEAVFFLAPIIAFCAPWVHPPISSFYIEFFGAAAAVSMIFAAWGKAGGRDGFYVGWPHFCLLVLILLVVAQLKQGIFEYEQSALVLLFVLVLAWGMVSLGQGFSLDARGQSQDWMQAFVAGLVAAAVLNSMVGILQTEGIFISGATVFRSYMGPRAMGFLGQANHLGLLCVIGIMSADMLLRQRLVRRDFVIVLSGLLFYALLLTESRGAMVAWCLWFIVAVFLDLKLIGRARLSYWLAMGCISVALMLNSIWGGGSGIVERVESLSIRGELYKEAFALLSSVPFLGFGWGNTAWALVDKSPLQVGVINNPHVHNIFLQMFVEWGWAGFLACVALFVDFAVRLFQLLRNARAYDFAAWALACEASLWVASLFEYPLWYVEWLLLFSFVVGLSQGSRGYWVKAQVHQAWVKLACVLAMLCLTRGYLDYQKVESAVMSMKEQSDAGRTFIKLDEGAHLSLYEFNIFQGESDLVLTRFMGGQRDDFAVAMIRKVARYRPFDETIARLILSDACLGEKEEAQRLVKRFDRAPRPERLFPMLEVYSAAFPQCMVDINWREKGKSATP